MQQISDTALKFVEQVEKMEAWEKTEALSTMTVFFSKIGNEEKALKFLWKTLDTALQIQEDGYRNDGGLFVAASLQKSEFSNKLELFQQILLTFKNNKDEDVIFCFLKECLKSPLTDNLVNQYALTRQILEIATDINEEYQLHILAFLSQNLGYFEVAVASKFAQQILEMVAKFQYDENKAPVLCVIASILPQIGESKKAIEILQQAKKFLLTNKMTIQNLHLIGKALWVNEKEQALQTLYNALELSNGMCCHCDRLEVVFGIFQTLIQIEQAGELDVLTNFLQKEPLAEECIKTIVWEYQKTLVEHVESPLPTLRKTFTICPFDASLAYHGASMLQAVYTKQGHSVADKIYKKISHFV